MKESKIIEFMKQGMRQARFQDMRKRQAARMLHEAEHPEKCEPIFDRYRAKSNSINITLNFLKKYWIAGDAELDRHVKILYDKKIIKNVDTVFDIQSDAPAVELLCLLNFWNNNRFTKFNRFPFKRICRHITHNEGKEFDPGDLKKMNYNYKQYEAFSKKPNERYLFFEKILLNK